MKKILTILVIIAAVVVGWFAYNQEQIPHLVQKYVENGEFVTLKARYTPEQIMEAHKKELLPDNQHVFQEPTVKYYPYLLLEVKYLQSDKKSREGMALWSLVDGEMVINTETWEQTHGFEDAINADANRNDFKLMQALARQRGSASTEQLQRDLHVEKETLYQWVESASNKYLIVQKGNEIQLHFQDPKILVQPETKITDWLVKKPYSHSQLVAGRYSQSQIQKIAKAAFGEDFAIRNATEVFLPIYVIDVVNPDGSTLTTFWNAITGERLSPRYNLR